MPYEPPRSISNPTTPQASPGVHGATDGAVGAATPTLSDTVDDPEGGFRAIYIAGAGNVTVTFIDGSTATIPAVPAGSYFYWQFRRVHSTGTTATGIVCFR